MIENKITTFIDKHQLIEKHKRVLVGVSGGPDSMALLHFLWSRQDEYNLDVVAIGIDHQLRADVSEEDMLYVEAQCKQWGIPFESFKVDVAEYKRVHKVGTQVAARTLRYDVFAAQMQQYEADYLALGHHGDDQVETMLMGMMRTTTLQGLQGIPFNRRFDRGEIIRPLLPLTKEEVESYCAKYDIKPRIDESNFEADYTRNELRLHVVPILKDKNHYIHQTIQQLSETVQEDERYLLQEAEKLMSKVVQLNNNEQGATIKINRFIKQPVSLQRRVFRLTLNYLYKQNIPDKISYTHEQIFLQLLHDSTSNKMLHFPQQLYLEKSYEDIHLFIKQEKRQEESYHIIIEDLPMRVDLPNHEVVTIRRVNEEAMTLEDKSCFIYPETELTFPLHIRHRKPGDRMSYEGLHGSKKIKDIFIDDKVPRQERDLAYIVTDNDDIVLWIIGMRKKAIKPGVYNSYIVMEYDKSNNEGGN